MLDAGFPLSLLDPVMWQNASPFLCLFGLALLGAGRCYRLFCLGVSTFFLAHILFTHTPLFFDAYRLGNEVDIWFTSSLFPSRQMYLSYSCVTQTAPMPSSLNGTFVHYLRTHRPEHKVDLAFKPERQATFYSHLSPCWGHHVWMLYSYATIKAAMPELRDSLAAAVVEHFGSFRSVHVPRRVVIHMRVGDFLYASNRLGTTVLTPAHVLKAVRELPFKPGSFLLLDGGSSHGASGLDERETRVRQKGQIILNALAKGLADIAPVNRSSASADEDFAAMVSADGLVTGVGSFGLAAAAANHHGHVRTPAMSYLNPNDAPGLGQRKVEKIWGNWLTYDVHSKVTSLPGVTLAVKRSIADSVTQLSHIKVEDTDEELMKQRKAEAREREKASADVSR